jgi:hypothetical protein
MLIYHVNSLRAYALYMHVLHTSMCISMCITCCHVYHVHAHVSLTPFSSCMQVEHIFVIGGGQVYAEAIKADACAAIHLTVVEQEVAADTHFPAIDPAKFKLWSASSPRQDNGTRCGGCRTCAAAAGAAGAAAPARRQGLLG